MTRSAKVGATMGILVAVVLAACSDVKPSSAHVLPNGDPAPTCRTATDCAGRGGDPGCITGSVCNAGYCAYSYAKEGTPNAEQAPGDCRTSTCDGAGGSEDAPDPSDVPTQVQGDCRTSSCDSNGAVVYAADDSDLPTSDGSSDCVTPMCKDGAPQSPAKPAGSLCATDDGRYCNAGGKCVYCAPLNAACDKPGPATATNATEATAYEEGTVGNDDSAGKEECGAFHASGEVDWYHYQGDTETILIGSPYENDPAAAVSSDADVTLCVYMTCNEGSTGDFVCPAGTTVAKSGGGHDGCCTTGKNPGMDVRHVCEDAGVWISVAAASTTTCAAYDVSFHY